MYHPLFVFDGEDGFPLAAVLCPGNTHDSHGAVTVLRRLLPVLRAAYQETLILVRADAGFAIPDLYDFLEEHKVRYVIGFITKDKIGTDGNIGLRFIIALTAKQIH